MRNLSPAKLFYSLAGLVVMATLAGCASATLTREECVGADWYQIGQTDGQAGYEISRLDAHREACNDTPALINEQGYRNGRDAGLVLYCTPSTGYALGRGGAPYTGLCPASAEPTFLQAISLGQEVHRAQAEVNRSELQVAQLERDISERRQALTTLVAIPASSRNTGHRQQIQQMQTEIPRFETQLSDASLSLENARRWLTNIEADTRVRVAALGT